MLGLHFRHIRQNRLPSLNVPVSNIQCQTSKNWVPHLLLSSSPWFFLSLRMFPSSPHPIHWSTAWSPTWGISLLRVFLSLWCHSVLIPDAASHWYQKTLGQLWGQASECLRGKGFFVTRGGGRPQNRCLAGKHHGLMEDLTRSWL